MAHIHFKQLYLQHFLQLLGVAMDTKCAPISGNLFMNHFDETYIYPLLTTKCNFYKRYIDDIFLLWQGTLEELEVFTKHPTILRSHSMQSIFSIATFTNPKTENCIRLYTPKQQTENYNSTSSHTIQSHQKEALRIAKHYVSEEYVQKKKNTPKR